MGKFVCGRDCVTKYEAKDGEERGRTGALKSQGRDFNDPVGRTFFK